MSSNPINFRENFHFFQVFLCSRVLRFEGYVLSDALIRGWLWEYYLSGVLYTFEGGLGEKKNSRAKFN